MSRLIGRILFWPVVGLLALSLVLTIIGGSMNYNAVLEIGIIAWLATSFLFFAWLVLCMWGRTKRNKG
jgi:hypothetical protein